MTPMTVAALYIDPRGPYPKMPGVDCWDAVRDASGYAGPWPVVAHPPCGPWGKLRHFCKKDDPGLAIRAVEQVRQWGGVLEHPAHSRLWVACDLPRPGELPDAWGGRSIEVEQVRWGHPARKLTWLYLVGVDHQLIADPPPRKATHWVSGNTRTQPPGIKICSAQQRRRTPQPFADWLVALAASSVRAA